MAALNLPEDHYILHVMYDLVEGKENHTGDTQLFVTGTVAYHEEPDAACFREVSEEIMMRPKRKFKPLYSTTVKSGSWLRGMSWFGCKMNHLKPSYKPVLPIKDGRNKVGCIIHGALKDAHKLLERMRVERTSTDGIVGAVCLRVKDVLSILRLQESKYSKFDKFFWRGVESPKDVYAFTGRHIPAGMQEAICAYSTMAMPDEAWLQLQAATAKKEPSVDEACASLQELAIQTEKSGEDPAAVHT